MIKAKKLRVKLFADGADKKGMLDMYQNPLIKGFTTNPTLMRKAGISNYKAFAQDILSQISDRPVCFEVFADDFSTMEKQAHEIHSWGQNVVIKVPITNTLAEFSGPLVQKLSTAKIPLNVTAILSLEQIKKLSDFLCEKTPTIVSIFAGRIADTGVDPVPLIEKALEILKPFPKAELLWASPRELFNIIQANELGCHIITATNDILHKLNLLGKNLNEYSLETVKMFYNDAQAAGFEIFDSGE